MLSVLNAKRNVGRRGTETKTASSKKGEGRRRRTDDREITLRYIAVKEQYLFWKMVVKEISKPHTEKR